MKSIRRSFYARLSAIFLILIIALGAGTIAIAFNAAGHLFDEVEQLLNRGYAANIAEAINPLVADGFSVERIAEQIHYIMVLNPMVEIYLLDGAGTVVSYFTHPNEELQRLNIDIDPVRRFVASRDALGEGSLILGDDPRNRTARKPFSAAPLRMGDDEGYVYVILRGNSYDRSLAAIRQSYYLRIGFLTFLFAILATLAVGLSLFFLLTRRLAILNQAVRSFDHGELDRRIHVSGTDEISDLGRAFNEMAASIEAGVEKIHESERQRTDLIANISHDLRSPLTSIRGNLETVLLREPQLDSAERTRLLEISLKNVASFQRLVEDLFELARLEAKQLEPAGEPFQLAELAQDVVLKLKPRAESKAIDLRLIPPEGLPLVYADIGMIERVLTNLIENALRYTPKGGSIDLSLEASGTTVRIAIRDSGSGIAPEDLPHIFDRFYRADKSRNRTGAGVGLGLAIAKEIVELNNGDISVESAMGIGSTFMFDLPVA